MDGKSVKRKQSEEESLNAADLRGNSKGKRTKRPLEVREVVLEVESQLLTLIKFRSHQISRKL